MLLASPLSFPRVPASVTSINTMKTPFISLATALVLAQAASANCPAHFSDYAKQHLQNTIQLEQPAYKLNVVYFLGNDNAAIADYPRRLSELLIYLQQYYGKEMARNGYGNRAFGLDMLPNGNVNIILLKGKLPHKEYSYDKGPGPTIKEVEEFFKANPDKKLSQHTFVIMPTHYDDNYGNTNPGGVPFYGYGKYCFALDYPDFDIKHLGQDTPQGRLLTKWYGGFAHELGHGLNLPHNTGTCTQNSTLGTPLMNNGNYTFGLSPTYLTPASCRILDRSETFAVAGKAPVFYPDNAPKPTPDNIHLCFDGENIRLSLHCEANLEANVYIQDPPYQVNQDYDAVAFTMSNDGAPADGRQKKVVTIPLDELDKLKNTRKGEQRLDLYFINPQGNRFRANILLKWDNISPGDSIPVGELSFTEGY